MVQIKKAQIEMIGLVIIVLLIVIIAVFAFNFMSKDGKDFSGEYYSVKANNMINAIQKASVCQKNMETALIACCEEEVFCGVESCGYINDVLNGIFSKVEEEIYFELIDENGENCLVLGSTCDNAISSSSVFLRKGTSVSEIRLKICPKY